MVFDQMTPESEFVIPEADTAYDNQDLQFSVNDTPSNPDGHKRVQDYLAGREPK